MPMAHHFKSSLPGKSVAFLTVAIWVCRPVWRHESRPLSERPGQWFRRAG